MPLGYIIPLGTCASDYSAEAVFRAGRSVYPAVVSQNLALIQARKACGITQEQAAERLGVSQPTYQRWEAGTRYPRSKHLRAIAELFAVSADSLLSADLDPDAALVIRNEMIGRELIEGALKGLDRRQPIERQVNAMWAALVAGAKMVSADPSMAENPQAIRAAAGAVAQTSRD